MSKFTFHNVGQGLFYSGEIKGKEEKTFIYSCGTYGTKINLNNGIEDMPKKIDFLIIPDLQPEHINGLQQLIKKKKIGKIYLPHLDYNHRTSELFKLYFWNCTFNKWQARNVNPKWEEMYNKLVEIYSSTSNEKLFNMSNSFNKREKLSWIEFVRPTLDIEIECSSWNIKLFNSGVSEIDLYDFMYILETELKGDTIDNLIKTENYFELQYLYDIVFSFERSISSIVMLHYPNPYPYYLVGNDIYERYYIQYQKADKLGALSSKVFEHKIDNNVITLLTGDIYLDEELVNRIIAELPHHNFLICQIPNHGKFDNWESLGALQEHIDKAIISFELGNNLGFPQEETIKKLDEIKKEVVLVTQFNKYEYEFFDEKL